MKLALAAALSTGCLSLTEPPPPDCLKPRLLEELSDPLSPPSDDASPWLAPDRREILFSSDRGADVRLFNAKRESIDEPFDGPVEIAGLEIPGTTRDPFLEPDGLTLWFTVQEPMAQEPRIYRAQRAAPRSSTFAKAERVELGDGAHPSMTGDGLTLYFSRKNGASLSSIWRATRSSTSAQFGDAVEVTSVRGADLTSGHLRAPTINYDGNRLLFTYSTSGVEPFGIFESDVLGGEFEPGTPEQDTARTDALDSDQDPSFHAGAETFVFASDRTPGSSDLDIYVACE